MKVNVGLNRRTRRRGRRTVIEHRNIKAEFEGSWDSQADHVAFRERVRRENPGWNLSGYAIPREDRDD